jgi:hypothetical protein
LHETGVFLVAKSLMDNLNYIGVVEKETIFRPQVAFGIQTRYIVPQLLVVIADLKPSKYHKLLFSALKEHN